VKRLRDLEQVTAEVRRIVATRRGRNADVFEPPEEEVEALLGTISEFLPVWTALPSVFRVARIRTEGGTVDFSDNVALPAARHDLRLVVEMLNHIRTVKGLDEVKMPLFLQPDEIAYALSNPAECHCDEEQEIAARARSLKRLGRRGSRRWLYTGQDALDRDGRKCMRCGATKDLHVHATGGGKSWTDPAGWVTLCRRCHVVAGGGPSPAAARLAFHLPDGRVPGTAIRSQLALVFQKGSLNWVGVARGREYVILNA
jgi:5-methylcytosine-specific restriction endonuclease McrA